MCDWVRALSIMLAPALWLCAEPATAEPLQPTGKWAVDFGETQCVATRKYGDDKRPVHLAIKAPPMARIVQVAIVQYGTYDRPLQHNVAVTFGDAAPYSTTAVAFSGDGRRTHAINIPENQFAAIRDADNIRTNVDRGLDRTFQLDAMQALFSTLQECVIGLEAHWGGVIEAPDGPRPMRPAKGSLQSVFKWQDYPAAAVMRNQQGALRVLLMVDEKGRIADCTVVETSGIAMLDAQACAVIRARAKLQPARDEAGRAVRGLAQQRITWRLE